MTFDVSVVLVRAVVRINKSWECVHTFKSQGDMKQGSSNRRSRSRSGGGKRQSGGGRNSFESNGPDVKIRGTAQQVQEKYLILARDATSSGEWVSAEAYYQFAEHYYRIINSTANNGAGKNQGQKQDQNLNNGQGDRNARQQASQNAAAQGAPAPQANPQAETKAELQTSPETTPEGGAAQGEAKVIKTSPAALAASVAEREEAGATKTSKTKSDPVPEKAAS